MQWDAHNENCWELQKCERKFLKEKKPEKKPASIPPFSFPGVLPIHCWNIQPRFYVACFLLCMRTLLLPLASTLRSEQKGRWNLRLNFAFFSSSVSLIPILFCFIVLCFKMSQSVQVFGRKVRRNTAIEWLDCVDFPDTCIIILMAAWNLMGLYLKFNMSLHNLKLF